MFLTILECRGLAPTGNIIEMGPSRIEVAIGSHVSWKQNSQTDLQSRLNPSSHNSVSLDSYPCMQMLQRGDEGCQTAQARRMPPTPFNHSLSPSFPSSPASSSSNSASIRLKNWKKGMIRLTRIVGLDVRKTDALKSLQE